MKILVRVHFVSGETKRNVETRWNEHENSNKDFELAKHFRDFLIII